MNNQTNMLQTGATNASFAIQRILLWIEENYPRLNAQARAQLIAECLREVTAEAKQFSSSR